MWRWNFFFFECGDDSDKTYPKTQKRKKKMEWQEEFIKIKPLPFVEENIGRFGFHYDL